jgi:WD40 repeat protein
MMATAGPMDFGLWVSDNAENTVYKLYKKLPSHKESFFAQTMFRDLYVAISPDGRLLATGDGVDLKNGGGVKIWDIQKLLKEWLAKEDDESEPLFTLNPRKPDDTGSDPEAFSPTSMSFSEDSKLIAVGSLASVQVWDVSAKEPWREPTVIDRIPEAIKNGLPGYAAVSPDGRLVVSAGGVGNVKWLEVQPGQPVTLPPPEIVGTVMTKAITFSPDGKLLAVGGGGDEADNGVVTLWDVATRKPLTSPIGHRGVAVNVTGLAFSPDSRILASAGDDKILELWDVSGANPVLVATLEGHLAPLTSVVYSPDGKTIASGDESGAVHLWSTASRRLMLTLEASSYPIVGLAFDNESRALYTKDDKGAVRVWAAARDK